MVKGCSRPSQRQKRSMTLSPDKGAADGNEHHRQQRQRLRQKKLPVQTDNGIGDDEKMTNWL